MCDTTLVFACPVVTDVALHYFWWMQT